MHGNGFCAVDNRNNQRKIHWLDELHESRKADDDGDEHFQWAWEDWTWELVADLRSPAVRFYVREMGLP